MRHRLADACPVFRKVSIAIRSTLSIAILSHIPILLDLQVN
jgi:hypothetical protein